MRILALDLGIHTGVAYLDENGRVKSETINFRKSKKDTHGQIYWRFEKWLENKVRCGEVGIVVYEMPHNRGGATTEMLNTFAGLVQLVCFLWQIPFKSVHSKTIKKFMTGNGNANKEDMMKAVRKKHPEIKDLDEHQADSIALLDFCLENKKNLKEK